MVSFIGGGAGIDLTSGAPDPSLEALLACRGASGMVLLMAKQVRLILAKAIAKASLRRAQAGVAATTITRLARTDDKAASALSLDLAAKIVTVLDCGIEDFLEVTADRG